MSEAAAASRLAAEIGPLLAVDPVGLGGVVLRGSHGGGRDGWLASFRALLPSDAPWRRLPLGIGVGRLLGGLDLTATLAAGRPIVERGLLAETSGGVLLLPSAERLASATTSALAAALDHHEVVMEREGVAARFPARLCLIAFDEGMGDERVPAAMAERLAFSAAVEERLPDSLTGADRGLIAAARELYPLVDVSDEALEAICGAALSFGVWSPRAAIFATRAARASAALYGRDMVEEADLDLATALVLAPRATRLPAAEPSPEPSAPEPNDQAQEEEEDHAPQNGEDDPSQGLVDSVTEAVRAALPADLLASLAQAAGASRGSPAAGRAGVKRVAARRGRPVGTRHGAPSAGARLALVATLRAAAPWQRIRRRASPSADPGRVLVRLEDLRVARFQDAGGATTIFVVDASGSAALGRLAEVKGAVELVLAECYVRRDEVALIAFRRGGAELVLPPTRSLVRAKRTLAGQVGGGGTPLASAIAAATDLADAVRRRGRTPLVVLLTDGRANIGRDGQPGRARAEADAKEAARAFRGQGAGAILLDIAPRPGAAALDLAAAMGARYVPLPYADAASMSAAVLSAAPPAGATRLGKA